MGWMLGVWSGYHVKVTINFWIPRLLPGEHRFPRISPFRLIFMPVKRSQDRPEEKNIHQGSLRMLMLGFFEPFL